MTRAAQLTDVANPTDTGLPAPPATRMQARILEIPPAVLAVLAEGAWIGVLAALIQSARGEGQVLGPIAFAAIAGVGLVVGRVGGARLVGSGAWAMIGLMVVAALAGWLTSDAVRSTLLTGNWAAAVGRNQGGFLAGLAVLRGLSHAVPTSSERSLARLLAWGTPLLAIPLLIAQSFPEPGRSAFETQALADCLLFLLTATLALALARVANLGRSAGFGWQHNRAWLEIAVLSAVIAVTALPLADLVGPAVRLTLALTVPPVLLIAAVISLGQVTLRAVTIVVLVGVVVFALSRLAQNLGAIANVAGTPPGGSDQTAQDPTAAILTWVPIVAIAMLLIVFLVRRWLRRPRIAGFPSVVERRSTDDTGDGASLLGGLPRRLFGRRPASPRTAVEAYLATLADYQGRADLARATDETPADHARRLRTAGSGAIELDLLAADYQLARFGADPLSPAEDRRAVGRWRRLHDRVRVRS